MLKVHYDKDDEGVMHTVHVSEVKVLKSAQIRVSADEIKELKELEE